MIHPPRHPKPFAPAALGALLAALLCGACEAPSTEVHPFWPPPPAAPRILHLKTARGPTDLAKPNFFEALGNLFTGPPGQLLLRPSAIAVSADQRLYITDQERQAVVVMDMTSTRHALIDRAGNTYFVSPLGVAVCGQTLAVSDSALNAVFLLSLDGKFQKSLQKPEGFKRVSGLAYDAGNHWLYAVDTLANEVCAFDLSSGKLVRRFGAPGIEPGQFNFPTHIFLDAAGKIYVTDSLNFRVQAFSPEGKYLFHIGQLGDATGHMAVPKGVGVDSYGHIYVMDSYFGALSIFDQRGRFLLSIGEVGDGAGAFQVPAGLTVDSKNRIYVCDSYNKRIQIFQYVGGAHDDEPTTAP